jgi:purine-binding chemotaxis protein CheW
MQRSMTAGATTPDQALIVTTGSCACAIPAYDVVETMRPLPIESIAGMPAFVRGVSVIRGIPIPVLDLGALLQIGDRRDTCGRFVTVKIGERRAALAVDGVIGLRILDPARMGELPSLLRAPESHVIDAIGTSDAQLLVLLRSMRIVPDEVWTALEARETA